MLVLCCAIWEATYGTLITHVTAFLYDTIVWRMFLHFLIVKRFTNYITGNDWNGISLTFCFVLQARRQRPD